jgi:hypothetical protein
MLFCRKEQKELEKQEKDLGIPVSEDTVAAILAPQDDEVRPLILQLQFFPRSLTIFPFPLRA